MPKSDIMVLRKKAVLKTFITRWNGKNPKFQIDTPAGVKMSVPTVNKAEVVWLKNMQQRLVLPVTGKFDYPTMLKLFPNGTRGAVMALAYSELEAKEWPSAVHTATILSMLTEFDIGPGNLLNAAFVAWVLRESGCKQFPQDAGFVPAWLKFAESRGLLKNMSLSKPGDIWIWNWDNGLVNRIGFCDEGECGITAYSLAGNVGLSSGILEDAERPDNGVAYVIDLVGFSRLKRLF